MLFMLLLLLLLFDVVVVAVAVAVVAVVAAAAVVLVLVLVFQTPYTEQCSNLFCRYKENTVFRLSSVYTLEFIHQEADVPLQVLVFHLKVVTKCKITIHRFSF